MKQIEFPMTQAIRMLRAAHVGFTAHLYPYIEHGGTAHAAECLQVPHRAVVKTLVFEADAPPARKRGLIVLMHGDCEVSAKQLARIIGAKTVTPASREAVEKYTGYIPGGVSPFGTRAKLETYMERSIGELRQVYINGGKRGFLVEIGPSVLQTLLRPIAVEIAIRENPAR